MLRKFVDEDVALTAIFGLSRGFWGAFVLHCLLDPAIDCVVSILDILRSVPVRDEIIEVAEHVSPNAILQALFERLGECHGVFVAT